MKPIAIDRIKTLEHTHFVLEDGSIIKIKRFPHMVVGDRIIFHLLKPIDQAYNPFENFIEMSLAPKYDYEDLEIIGYTRERREKMEG